MAHRDLIATSELQEAYNKEVQGVSIFSAKISELCKFIWVGSLAVFYGALSSGKDTAAFIFYQQNKAYIFAAAICGSCALVADYFQYLAAHRHSTLFVRWIATTKDITRDQFNAHATSIFLKINFFFFVAKNICCIAAALLIAFSIVNFVAQ